MAGGQWTRERREHLIWEQRQKASQTSPDRSVGVTRLLDAMRRAGANAAATTLADRAASQNTPENPKATDDLLHAMQEAGAGDAVTTLANRAASQVTLDNPSRTGSLLEAMQAVGAEDAVIILARVAPATPACSTCISRPTRQRSRHTGSAVSLMVFHPITWNGKCGPVRTMVLRQSSRTASCSPRDMQARPDLAHDCGFPGARLRAPGRESE